MRCMHAAAAALLLAVAGCAGTPPPGEQANAGHPSSCEHTTGSMLCSSSDDQPLASPNSPGSTTPSANLSQSVQHSSH